MIVTYQEFLFQFLHLHMYMFSATLSQELLKHCIPCFYTLFLKPSTSKYLTFQKIRETKKSGQRDKISIKYDQGRMERIF